MNAPTREEKLATARQTLLEERRLGSAAARASVLIPRRPRDDGTLPLSFAQRRLWFMDQMSGGNAFYNVPSALRLKVWLHAGVLERSLNEIVGRHEALRTRFVSVDGQPQQVVEPQLELKLRVHDLRHLATAQREAAAQELAREEARTPFDLSTGPLIRAALVQLGPADSLFLVSMHHIVSDGWSMGVFFEELTALYGAYAGYRASPLPPLPLQYADYAVWQRQWLQGPALEEQLAYWQGRLQGLSTLALPTDHPRPAVPSYRGARLSRPLPLHLGAALNALCRRSGATLFMTLLAAFQVLLHRYSGQDDIVVGVPIAGRTRPELERLIGFFVNTLVLRADCVGDPRFIDFLQQTREAALGAYAHQDVPFELLVERLHPERDLSRNPLFQVGFALQNAAATATGASTLSDDSQVLEVERGSAIFDLALHLWETPRGLMAHVEYSTELFEPATIERLLGHLQTLLESIAEDPTRRLSQLALLTPAERRQLLHDWNDTRSDYPEQATLHQLFEAQAQRSPQAAAVVSGEETLSYAELNRRANRIAARLIEQGVQADEPVGLCVQRSTAMVAALLGVLKAGGAYVPLDPEYPAHRLQYMLRDARVRVLLASPDAPDLGQGEAAAIRIVLNGWEAAPGNAPDPAPRAGPEHLAYIIYTSGSTGTPKGVMVAHRAICNHMHWMQQRFPLAADDCVLQKTPISFDASVWEFYAPLLAGARLALAAPGEQRDPAGLAGTIAERRVTTLQVVPSLLQLLVDTPEFHACQGLRRLFCGGEPLTDALASRVLRLVKHAQLINLYGPTEATIDATFAVCTDAGPVTIGRPIANLRAYVLDKGHNLVPVGVPGELCIAGEGLARGYVNDARATAEKFVTLQLPGLPAERIYRTGDLVSWRQDGTLYYLGRIDHQVKIRGHRIELGEIEAALLAHPAVSQAIVVAHEPAEKGAARLAAYVVAMPGSERAAQLRTHLKERLPEYMVPGSLVLLEELPLGPNGKVDRQALPAPDGLRPELGVKYAAPRTAAERTLAEIWAEVLGLDRVGIEDNFFELGGDSILSIQIIARANRAGLKLTPPQLFQHQSVAELAAAAGSSAAMLAEPEVVSGQEVPLSPIQHWFFEHPRHKPEHFNQAVLVTLQHTDAARLQQALDALVRHHDALRLRYQGPSQAEAQGQGWRQYHGPVDEQAALQSTALGHLQGQAQARALSEAASRTQASLDLQRGPLLRAELFDLGAGQQRLLLVIHHLAVDGVSWRILLEDLTSAYGQLCRGEAVRLPRKTSSFGQWAQRLVEHAASAAAQEELGYWQQQAQQLPRQQLPGLRETDAAPELNTVASRREISTELDAPTTQALLQQVPAAYRTQINDALLSALLRSWQRCSGQATLWLDLEGHGREDLFDDIDLTRTVGWFTSLFPVRLECDPQAPCAQTLQEVKEQLRRIPRRGIGYGVLRYLSGDAQVRRTLAQQPAPKISFNYLGQLSAADAPAHDIGPAHAPQDTRRHLIEVNGSVEGGVLRMHWAYSEHFHHVQTMHALADSFTEELRALVEHCRSPHAGGYTPSDFGKARGVTQPELNRLLERIRHGQQRGEASP